MMEVLWESVIMEALWKRRSDNGDKERGSGNGSAVGEGGGVIMAVLWERNSDNRGTVGEKK